MKSHTRRCAILLPLVILSVPGAAMGDPRSDGGSGAVALPPPRVQSAPLAQPRGQGKPVTVACNGQVAPTSLLQPAVSDARLAVQDTLPNPPAGKKWQRVWHDEFDGTVLDESKWVYRPDGPRKDGWWSKSAVSLDGKGHLRITTTKEGEKYVDGCITTQGKFEKAFGFFVARIQLHKSPGHWPAFWITGPGVGKVGSGGREGCEIDIMEKPWRDERVQHALHWDGYGKDHKTQGQIAKGKGVMEGFHTYGLWWKPDEYVFYIDGQETWRTKADKICQVPEYLLLSDEVGKWGGDISKAALPDEFLVDYVRVYDLTD